MKKTKHGMQVYVAMLHGLKTPATAREVGERHGVCACNARYVLRGMYSLGLVHVHGWKRVGAVGINDRVYAAGEGVDALHPPSTRAKPSAVKATKTRAKPSLIAFAALWRALDEPISVVDMVEETGLGQQAIYRFLKYAHSIGATKIVGWSKVYNVRSALYGKGSGKNVPRPAREDTRIISKRKRAKVKARLIDDTLSWRMAA